MNKTLSNTIHYPGKQVSIDHFIVTTPGRLLGLRGLSKAKNIYKGGVIFKDPSFWYIHVEPVINFTAAEAIQAKQEFEYAMSTLGVTVTHYHTDNGVFTSSAFQGEL